MMLSWSGLIDRLKNAPWGRFRANAGKLVAATLFTGTAAGLYFLTPAEGGPIGATILEPRDNATMTESDDDNHNCADGFQTTIRIRTNAPDGTPVQITSNGLLVATPVAMGHQVLAASVQLGSSEDHVLLAQVGPARAFSSVHVACAGAPKCRLLGPTWSPEHPRLNTRRRGFDLDAGADAGDSGAITWVRIGGGDRSSANGSPYQFSVDLETDLAQGGRIEPFVDGASQGAATKTTAGSQDRIDAVPMPGDGQHSLAIKCTQGAAVGFSTRALVTVDTSPAQMAALTVGEGYHFPAAMILAGGKIRVCASSVSADAIDLPADMNDARLNFCAGVGTSSPICAAMVAAGADPAYADAALPEGGSLCDGAASCMCPAWSWCAPGQDAAVNTLTGSVTCYAGSAAVSTNNTLRCSGCPSGTTITPTTGDLFNCVLPDGGKPWSGQVGCTGPSTVTLPDGAVVGLNTQWDGGCYSCPNDGGAACLRPWNAGIDGGCRECQYVQPDGAVRPAGWQCPWCDDATRSRNGACVELACPGPAPFALRLSLYDSSRNLTTRLLQGVTCEVAGPSVEIVDPIGGSLLDILEDIGKRVLAFSTTTAPRRDIDPATAGAQYNVIACTDAASGSSAELLAGPAGGLLVRIATTTVSAPDAAGVCAAMDGKPRQVRFAGVTLPESGEDGLGRLRVPTRLRAAVTVGAAVGISADVDLWVDSTVPAISWKPGFCGQHFASVDAAAAAARKARANTNTLPVTVEVVNDDGTRRSVVTEFAPEQYQ